MPEFQTGLSIIIPIKDEAENILSLAAEIEHSMKLQSWTWECIWVDDGSTDDSRNVLKNLHESNPIHKVITLKKNEGQSTALWAGFHAAKGSVIVTLDGDGQNDPSHIPEMAGRIFSGEADIVNGIRQKRLDSWKRIIVSKIANGFRNWMTGVNITDVGCALRAFRRECIDHIIPFKGFHRFLPVLLIRKGFRAIEIPVRHHPRKAGQTKYTINNRLWVGLYDLFGVMWILKRACHYQIQESSSGESVDQESPSKQD